MPEKEFFGCAVQCTNVRLNFRHRLTSHKKIPMPMPCSSLKGIIVRRATSRLTLCFGKQKFVKKDKVKIKKNIF